MTELEEKNKAIDELNLAYQDCREKLRVCRMECEQLRQEKLTIGEVVRIGHGANEQMMIVSIKSSTNGISVYVA